MARPKLVSPDQPLPVRILLHIYQFLASLSLAVILLSSMAIALMLATFVEATFSTAVVQFYVYRAWWFGALYCLLAVNIFCAATIRYPWKRHQTGFVITHIGLLVLLYSGVLSRTHGIDSQVHVWEDQSSHMAFDYGFSFYLTVEDENPSAASEPLTTPLAFQPGMFNWSEYQNGFLNWKVPRPDLAKYFSPLFHLASRNTPGDVLYDQDNIKVEVLDYYSDARWHDDTPLLDLRMSMPSRQVPGPEGQLVEAEETWVPINLMVRRWKNEEAMPRGLADSQKRGGGSFKFWLADTRAATEAFLKTTPKGSLGEKGQVVLVAGGQKTVVQLDDLEDASRVKLPGTSLEYEILEYMPNTQVTTATDGSFRWVSVPESDEHDSSPGVRIGLFKGDGKVEELTLLADMPEHNQQAYEQEVFGDFWFDHGEKDAAALMQGEGGSRIDIIQGVAEGAEDPTANEAKRLYYRYWNRKQVVFARELPAKGSRTNAVDAFEMPIGKLKMFVNNFVPSHRPRPFPEPLAFSGKPDIQMIPAAQVRMTVGDQSETFWLKGHFDKPDEGLDAEGGLKHEMTVGGKTVRLVMPINAVDIGFRIFLTKFERHLDPGTSQAAHYSSDVHYLDRYVDRRVHRAESGLNRPRKLHLPSGQNPTHLLPHGDWIYWIDSVQDSGTDGEKSIFAATLADLEDPEAHGTRLIQVAAGPQGIAVDAERGKLLWTNFRAARGQDMGSIMQCDLDGKNVETIARFSGRPGQIAVDGKEGWVFFVNRSRRAIGRVRTDGSDLNERWFSRPSSDPNRIATLAVHTGEKAVYWLDASEQAILAIDYQKELQPRIIRTSGEALQDINSLAIDSGRGLVYWTDIAPNDLDPHANKHRNNPNLDRSKPRAMRTRVRMLNLENKEVVTLTDNLLDQPDGIAVDQATGEVYWSQTALLKKDVWITMNAPDDFTDPIFGRDVRVFQESFLGPFKAGTPEYRQIVPVDSNAPEVYRSVFSVNYDPGTTLRYWGCMLVVGGISCMFYMRAYFFKTKKTKSSVADQRRPETSSRPAEAVHS